mmetsp:Transcript_31124/g.41166  ORF Transcript_31124/g.41166 Transcript_31124/m.41166 type:complete len:229 (-) Transcript_31124:905-1591(-)
MGGGPPSMGRRAWASPLHIPVVGGGGICAVLPAAGWKLVSISGAVLPRATLERFIWVKLRTALLSLRSNSPRSTFSSSRTKSSSLVTSPSASFTPVPARFVLFKAGAPALVSARAFWLWLAESFPASLRVEVSMRDRRSANSLRSAFPLRRDSTVLYKSAVLRLNSSSSSSEAFKAVCKWSIISAYFDSTFSSTACRSTLLIKSRWIESKDSVMFSCRLRTSIRSTTS